MIKNSKLIGTKIAAPYGWKTFKLGELFDVCTTTGFDAGKLVFSNEGTPFIGRTDNNYGFQGFVNDMIGVDSNPANVISISQIGSQSAQYRKEPWYASQNIFYVELLDGNLTLYVGLFFVSIFNKLLQQYSGYTSYPTKNSIFDWIIDLPVTSSGQPDFAWMEQYMKLVQEDYLKQKELSNQAEIKAYLTEGHTDSLKITDADRQFMRDFEKLPRRKFKVLDFLILKNSPDVHFEQKKLPLISAGDNNHGIRSWGKTFEYCNNVITISKLGQTFYYHQNVCYTDDVLGLQLPVDSILFGIYLQTLLNNQTRQISSYGHQFRMKRLDELSLLLPTSVNDEIDVHSIEKYMRIQSKSLINKVAEALAPAGTTD